MGDSVRFVLPGKPQGKAVAKVTKFGTFIPAKTRAEMDALRMIARLAMGGRKPFDGPVELRLAAYMPVPVSWSRKKREAALAGRLLPITKPDGSNIQKLCEDALIPKRFSAAEARRLTERMMAAMNDVVLHDDAQITDWRGWKRYSADPRVVVEVRQIDLEGDG